MTMRVYALCDKTWLVLAFLCIVAVVLFGCSIPPGAMMSSSNMGYLSISRASPLLQPERVYFGLR